MEQRLSQQVATRARSMDAWSFSAWLPNPDPVLKAMGKDIQVYRDLRADAHVGGAVRRRRAAVKALERGLSRRNAPNRVFTNLQAILEDIDITRLITESLDACLYGYQPLEVTWGKVGSFIVPVDVASKPPEWFTFDTDNQLRFRSRQSPLYGEELPERKFLLPRQDATYDNPYGFPDLSMVFWPTAFKKGGLKFWVTFTEKFGMPLIVGKQPRHATPAETNDLLDKLESMVQDAVAVIPDDDSIEIMAPYTQPSSANFESLLMFCRAEVSTALLGTNQTTETNSTNASAQAGLSVAAEIRDGDAGIAAGAINDLLKWICDINFGSVPRPVYELWDQEAMDTMQASRDERLSNAGARLSNQYFANAYDLKPGDLLEQSATVTPPASVAPVNFAEADPKQFPDQAALDDALRAEGLQASVDGLLAPLLAAIQQADNEQEALGMLADAYPSMDDTALTKALTRLLFAAAVVGKLSVQGELDEA